MSMNEGQRAILKIAEKRISERIDKECRRGDGATIKIVGKKYTEQPEIKSLVAKHKRTMMILKKINDKFENDGFSISEYDGRMMYNKYKEQKSKWSEMLEEEEDKRHALKLKLESFSEKLPLKLCIDEGTLEQKLDNLINSINAI
jgi:hypothetical protein